MSTQIPERPTTETHDDALLSGLNEAQKTAVTHDGGPLLIVAGAGTGKTTVIARRAAWLISTGRAKPEEILALTFTEKAAGEMVERIDALLPMGYVDLWVSTFHSFCQRLLDAHAIDIGLPGDARLLNGTDAYLFVRRNFDAFDLDYYRPLGNPNKFIYSLLSHFSRAKDEAVTPEEYLAYAKDASLDKDDPSKDATEPSRLSEVANAYHTYQRLLLENSCMDFGDLLLYALRLFRTRPTILEKYRKQFKYVIVDEFQDTNWAQYELLKMLVPQGGNIVVVGDDDQAIYKFRGASVANILQFKDDYPDAREVVLTRNYRSKQGILDLSYAFIQHNNPNRLEVRLADARKEGEPAITKRLTAEQGGESFIEHLHFASLDDEVAGVADRIIEMKDDAPDRTWNDFAILVRSNAGADAFADELQRRGIPYQFMALKGLYGKPVVLDILSYFRLLDDYHESAAVYRVLSCPAYAISGKDIVALAHEARRRTESLYHVLRSHQTMTALDPETHGTIDRLMADVGRHTQDARHKKVSELLVRFLYDSGYAEVLKRDDTTEARDRVSHLKQFLERVRRFETGHDDPTLRHFLEELELERESGEEGGLRFDVETGPDMVRITTVHAAKGLEFPVVFIVNLVDKRFPAIGRAGGIELPDALTKEIVQEGDVHLEEERRLFYVAMTRAKHALFFTSADDYGGKTKKKPSRFLDEMGYAAPDKATVAGARGLEEPRHPLAEKKPEYDPPDYYSFTQLAAYDTCPLQYKYAHVLRLPVLGKYQMSFGKTMHAVLERLVNEIATRGQTAQGSLFGGDDTENRKAGLPITKDEMLAMYEEEWIDEWYPDRAEKEKYRKEGKEALERIYDEMAASPPDPLCTEKDFKLKFGDHWIRGKVDRIDRLPDGKVRIVDYKTGAPKDPKSLKKEDKRQLHLYHMAVKELMALEPAELTFKYLRDGSEATFTAQEKDLESLRSEIEGGIAKIATGDFAPTPGRHCTFCDFKEICEFRD